MITLDDCAAFCAATPEMVRECADCESLPMVLAYARAHNAMLCANDSGMQNGPTAPESPSFRIAA